MIIIYPMDPTTAFLKPIVEKAKNVVKFKLERTSPENYDETLRFIDEMPTSKTLVFLGHGFSEGLYGGCYVPDGRQVLLRKDKGETLLNNRKVVLFCCRSSEFLLSFEKSFNVAIGFGNIKTTKEDLLTPQDKKKYRDVNCIRIFRDSLVSLFAISLAESCEMNYTFLQYYNLLKLRINKCICVYSLSDDPNERLAGELLYGLKKEMILIGNVNTLFNEV